MLEWDRCRMTTLAPVYTGSCVFVPFTTRQNDLHIVGVWLLEELYSPSRLEILVGEHVRLNSTRLAHEPPEALGCRRGRVPQLKTDSVVNGLSVEDKREHHQKNTWYAVSVHYHCFRIQITQRMPATPRLPGESRRRLSSLRPGRLKKPEGRSSVLS